MLADIHIENLIEIAGPRGATQDRTLIAPRLKEWRDKFDGQSSLMLMPKDTVTASELIAYCHENCVTVVPQGGNTGLVGGGIPGLEGRNEVLFSTHRMTDVCVVDAEDFSITASAGCTIASLQAAAAEHGLLFPLSLASEGSCTVGGVVSTNAGGIHVLRYGTTRALTLGVEAILPTGAVINELTALRKNNTGYNLSQLLVGAEGTLGLITKATFKLYPQELQKHTCLLAVESPQKALSLLSSARRATGDRVSAFELIPRIGLDFVLRHIPGTSDPLQGQYPWYVLTEIATTKPDTALETEVSSWLETELEAETILDGAVAASLQQAQDFWKLRESMSEAQKLEGGSIKHDIAVPVSCVPEFLERATQAVEVLNPNARLVPFGHLGDGNIHFNVMQPADGNKVDFLATWTEISAMVHDVVVEFGGSISAEHGIGTLKKDELSRLKSASEIAAMKAIKAALDPHNIMNPGCLFM